MLQSSHRAGTPPRGDNVQPFGGHPAKGRDGSNVVRPAIMAMHPTTINMPRIGSVPSVGALEGERHSNASVICVQVTTIHRKQVFLGPEQHRLNTGLMQGSQPHYGGAQYLPFTNAQGLQKEPL